MTAAQIVTFPATRHPKFAALSGAVSRRVRKHVAELSDSLLRIAATEYGELLRAGMREDIAMERADDLLCGLLEAAERERHKLLVELSFASPGP